ncbi:MAG: DUF3108 domain-containing protein [Planctomycetota bacterium]
MQTTLLLAALWLQTPVMPTEPTPTAPPPAPPPRIVSYPQAERLTYSGTLTKAGISVDVGRAEMEVTRNESGQRVFRARAKGEKFGYTLDTEISSTLRLGDNLPEIYHYVQRGSEQRQKKLSFHSESATFARWKHCKTPNCTDENHAVTRSHWVGGILPWGTERGHCTDKKCDHPEHYSWQVRSVIPLDEPHFDMLTAVYYARACELVAGGAPLRVPVLSDGDRWIVKATARAGERTTVAAGTFDTLLLVLEPEAAGATESDARFSGLFGLNGEIRIWIDKATHRPILVQGKLPFGFMDLHASIELLKVETDAVSDDSANARPVPTSHESDPRPSGEEPRKPAQQPSEATGKSQGGELRQLSESSGPAPSISSPPRLEPRSELQ